MPTFPSPLRARARPASFRPALEVLEDRCLLAAAALDPTFNGNGKQTLGFAGGSVTATAVAVKVGFGKIIVAGDFQPTGSTAAGTFALARFNPDGSFDTAFGSGGRVTIDFGPLGRNAQATAVYQQIDDKIVVGGSVVTPTGSHDFAIARLTAAGALDGSFGTGGKQTIDFGFDDFLTGLAIQQSDQKIVVAGHGNSTGAAVFEVARLGTNGSLDASFGSGGKEIVPVGTVGVANAVALQGDGKIVLAGATGPSGGPDNFAAVRLTAAGVPDTSFGSGGVQTVSFGADARANALTFQPGDNKIVLAGFTTVSTSLGATPVMAATRLNTNGTLDTSFGTGGKVNTAAVYFGSLSQQRSSTANGVGVDLANKILLVGSWGRPNDPTRGAFDILRLNADGSLDQNFNPAFAGPQAAEFTVGFGDNSVSQGNAVVLYGPDQLVVVGSTAPVVPGTPPTVGASSFAVARLNQLSMGPSSTAGMFDPSTGTWYLKNSNSAGAPDFAPFRYGAPGWVPLVGDWNADRAATVGVFDPATATWYLKNSNSPGAPDIAPFAYGAPGWIPVLGSLGDPGMPRYGIPPHGAAVGVVDPSTMTWYLKNSNTPGAPDIAPFRYGQPGDIPVVGNWLGGFSTGIGVFRPSNATWYLRNSRSAGAPDIPPFAYGASYMKPVVGDWDGDGKWTVGVYTPSGNGAWLLRNSNTPGAPDVTPFAYGAPVWTPVAGHYIQAVEPLAADGEGPGATSLSTGDLNAIFQAALGRLQQAGVPQALLGPLSGVTALIQPLAPGQLGEALPGQNTIVLSPDGAGHGWFVDPTPNQDEEFVSDTAFAGSSAAEREDLLTTVLHELGHLAGLGDDSGSALMAGTLPTGTRRADALNAAFAGLGA